MGKYRFFRTEWFSIRNFKCFNIAVDIIIDTWVHTVLQKNFLHRRKKCKMWPSFKNSNNKMFTYFLAHIL